MLWVFYNIVLLLRFHSVWTVSHQSDPLFPSFDKIKRFRRYLNTFYRRYGLLCKLSYLNERLYKRYSYYLMNNTASNDRFVTECRTVKKPWNVEELNRIVLSKRSSNVPNTMSWRGVGPVRWVEDGWKKCHICRGHWSENGYIIEISPF